MKKHFNFKVVAIMAVLMMFAVGLPAIGPATPKQISPPNNSHFTHFPRTVTVKWQHVKGAMGYDVEIDCLHCRKVGQWDTDNGPAWKTATNIHGTSYSFTFVADNKARWRVRSVRGPMKSNWSSWWYFDFKTGGAGTDASKKLPDLIVKNIELVKNCKIAVTLKNIGTAGVPDSYYNLPNAVAVQMYNGSQPWGGIILSGFDKAGSLKSPGGTATWTWFPEAANLNLTSGTHTIKVVVDSNSALTELNETNNTLSKQLKCTAFGTVTGTTLGTPPIGTATPAPTTPDVALIPPQRFFVDFTDAYLVFSPATKSIQIAAQTNVLSYGSDWEKFQLKPYLYHIRQNVWQGFFWQVNTSRKEVHKVTGGTFCKVGGNHQKLDINVDVVGGSDTVAPDRFLLRFPSAYLVYVPSSKTLQVVTLNTVLSYGGDWEKCNLNGATYHLRENFWKGFYWRITTGANPTAVRVRGTFCTPGSFPTEPLNVNVRVVK